MKKFWVLLFIAILTFVAVLYVKRPDLLSHVWLWIVGLAAPIIGLFKRIGELVKNWFQENIQKKLTRPAKEAPAKTSSVQGPGR
jgi:hypothetical protein